MSIVFPGGACALAAADNSRSELILLSPESGSGDNIFLNVYIMNFSSIDKADYQINKNIDQSFIYSTFGHAVTALTVHGFQAPDMNVINSKNKITTSRKRYKDIETVYREWCIASPTPEIIKIVTGNSASDGIVKEGTVHRGLMVAFEKKPMGEEKIQGYGFTISFICQRDDFAADSDDPNKQAEEQAEQQQEIDDPDNYGDNLGIGGDI